MINMLNKYLTKLINQELIENKGMALFAAQSDDQLVWNREDTLSLQLGKVCKTMQLNSILYAVPCEPYFSIVNYLSDTCGSKITSNDFETRVLYHDFPVITDFDEKKIIHTLDIRKAVIIKHHGIIASGMSSPEQAFIAFSSVCMSCYIKFFCEYLQDSENNQLTLLQKKIFEMTVSLMKPLPQFTNSLPMGPYTDDKSIIPAMEKTGKLTIEYGLVDSFFGNISYASDRFHYISQTGSSMDELGSAIDPYPFGDPGFATPSASIDYPIHREIAMATGKKAILHGHPKFSVIMSLACLKTDCSYRTKCHSLCPEKRMVKNKIPIIIPGEFRSDMYGINKTVSKAMLNYPGCIVFGHGVYAAGKNDFNEAFRYLLKIERQCFNAYFDSV
ncbi:MAG: rRNA adenine dimethylase [Desulfobacteraceae bacterium]|nr:rRNA adenine dimethylase [Desulfobacteraceae bacterium]